MWTITVLTITVRIKLVNMLKLFLKQWLAQNKGYISVFILSIGFAAKIFSQTIVCLLTPVYKALLRFPQTVLSPSLF